MARVNPDTYLPYVAITLNNLGLLHSDQNCMQEARNAFDDALAIRRELARANPDTNPDTYLPNVARILLGLGRMHATLNQATEAHRTFTESLSIFEAFAAHDPAQYKPLVDALKADLAKLPH